MDISNFLRDALYIGYEQQMESYLEPFEVEILKLEDKNVNWVSLPDREPQRLQLHRVKAYLDYESIGYIGANTLRDFMDKKFYKLAEYELDLVQFIVESPLVIKVEQVKGTEGKEDYILSIEQKYVILN